jgi:hypothetical protein
VLIGFAFGVFLGGAAGGGTPVAISGAIMVGCGFHPFQAAVLCLIAAGVAMGGHGALQRNGSAQRMSTGRMGIPEHIEGVLSLHRCTALHAMHAMHALHAMRCNAGGLGWVQRCNDAIPFARLGSPKEFVCVLVDFERNCSTRKAFLAVLGIALPSRGHGWNRRCVVWQGMAGLCSAWRGLSREGGGFVSRQPWTGGVWGSRETNVCKWLGCRVLTKYYRFRGSFPSTRGVVSVSMKQMRRRCYRVSTVTAMTTGAV